MLREIISRMIFALLLVSLFTGCVNTGLAQRNADLDKMSVQVSSVDWWTMFRHDLNHTGVSDLAGPITNHTLWNFATGAQVYGSSAVVEGFVYFGSYDRNVYCLRASNGSLVWSYAMPYTIFSSPAVVDGRVYIGAGEGGTNGRVLCLNATTGGWIWEIATSGADARLAGVYSSPAVADGRVYVGCNNGVVYCLNSTTGATIWTEPASGSIVSSPAVVDALVYVGANDGWVYCRNASNGSQVWRYHAGNGVISSPALMGSRIYVGSFDGRVYCLDATAGAQIWNFTTGGIIDSSPAVVDGRVYVGSYDGNLYCLNATLGTLVWSYATGAAIWASSPAIAGGLVYVGSNDTRLYCLNATSGSPVWSYRTGGGVVSSPTVVSAVYVGSGDGSMYAIGEPLVADISPSSILMDLGQSQLLTASVSGGTPSYSYQWFLNATQVSDATGSTWVFQPDSPGYYSIYVNVTDSARSVVSSHPVSATVNRAPSASVSPGSMKLDIDQSRLFTSTVHDGTPPYSYQWFLNDVAVSDGNSSTWMFAPESSGPCSVWVNVTDSVGFEVRSNTASTMVNPALSVAISPASATMNVSESRQFTSTVNGTAPYTYQWYLNGDPVDGATSDIWTFTPTSSDSYTLYLFVSDSAGEIAVSHPANITVNPVIPELGLLILPTLFMTATLLSVALLKRKKSDVSS